MATKRWCRRCGGPLTAEGCENCDTQAERGDAAERAMEAQQVELRAFVLAQTGVRADDTPIQTLIDTLLPAGDARAQLDLHFHDSACLLERSVDGAVERTIEVPGMVGPLLAAVMAAVIGASGASADPDRAAALASMLTEQPGLVVRPSGDGYTLVREP